MMLTKVFNQIPIFKDLTPQQHALLEAIFSLEECKCDAVVFEQGAEADYLYIVVVGEVAIVFDPDDGGPITVARLQKGGVFGWSAAFGSGAYTSGAICAEKSTLLKVLGEDLKKLRQNHPETGILILERLANVVAERLRNTNAHSQVFALLEHGLMNGIKPIGG
jgi:CRP-like cAMP-binding protein